MRIAVVGAGCVGLTTAACLARWGHEVTCVEKDPARLAVLLLGRLPLHEPDLDDLVRAGLRESRLSFVSDLAGAVSEFPAIILCVGTPRGKWGRANLSQLEKAVEDLAPHLRDGTIVVVKSTVPVGTSDLIQERLRGLAPGANCPVVFNPEFLREGLAVKDGLHPDRVVVGSADRRAASVVAGLFAFSGAPVLITDSRTAEMIKYAANAFLATKISFINGVACLCERLGADVTQVSRGIGLDPRIGPEFLCAGAGYGGSCFPKDVSAMIDFARRAGYRFRLLQAVQAINSGQRRAIVEKVRRILGDPAGKRVAVLGLAFKPRTDDIRYSPALTVIRKLAALGARVVAYDPVVKKVPRPRVELESDLYSALRECHAAVIMTDWPEIAGLDLARARAAMAEPNIIDGRNVIDPWAARRLGFSYQGVGRS